MRISTSLLFLACAATLPSMATGRDATDQPRVAYDYDFGSRGVELSGDKARWSGSWEGRYVDAAANRYEGVFRGTYLPPAPVTTVAATTAPATAMAAAPFVMAVPMTVPAVPSAAAPVAAVQPQLSTVYPAYGYPYGYAAPIIIRVEPAMTKTTTVVEEIIEP